MMASVLREAVTASNFDRPSGTMPGECTAGTVTDTPILLSGTYPLSLAGGSENVNMTGDLDIIGTVTIEGQGEVTIDANGIDRALHVFSYGDLTLRGITVMNGHAPDDPPPSGGG